MSRSWIAAAAAAVLVLTGCSGAAPSPQIPVGTCLEEYNGADSDRDTIVECTEPHQFDVIGSETWPEMAERIAATDAATVFDAITGETSDDAAVEIADAYWAWAATRYAPLTIEATGLTSVTVGGVTAVDMELVPGARWGWDASLATRDAFIAGDHATLYSMTWFNAAGDQIAASHPADVTIADIMSGTFTPELQGCFTRDPDAEEKYVNTECAVSHNGQYLFYADGLAALGADYMATVDPQSTVFADYGPLDAFCTELIDTALPGLLDSDDWGVWSDQVNRIAGWEEYDGTIDPSLTYPVYCAILTTGGKTIAGDVLAGDVKVSLSIG